MALLLGLTGNWGKKGTGTRSWAIFGMDGESMMPAKSGPGQEAAQEHVAGMIALRRAMGMSDPTQTKEMLGNRMLEVRRPELRRRTRLGHWWPGGARRGVHVSQHRRPGYHLR